MALPIETEDITCPNCGKPAPKLYPVQNVDESIENSLALGYRSITEYQYCATCLLGVFGVKKEELNGSARNKKKDMVFYVDNLKGSIGQAIITSVLSYFQYEVYPYGYESNNPGLVHHFRYNSKNPTVRQIRTTPDLLVVEPKTRTGHLVEVKATRALITDYWIEETKIKAYKECWPDSIMAVVHIPTTTIYCNRISNINLEDMATVARDFAPGKQGYDLNLRDHFNPISSIFKQVERKELAELTKKIKDQVLGRYGGKTQGEKVMTNQYP